MSAENSTPESAISLSSTDYRNFPEKYQRIINIPTDGILAPEEKKSLDFFAISGLMIALQKQCNERGWDEVALKDANFLTYLALGAAGAHNSDPVIHALSTGRTGQAMGIGENQTDKFLLKAQQLADRVSGLGRIIKIFNITLEESRIEDKIAGLFGNQIKILGNPPWTEAVLKFMNDPLAYEQFMSKRSILPPSAQKEIIAFSFLSPDDMAGVVKIFDATDKYQKSRLDVEAKKINTSSRANKLTAAGGHMGQIAGGAAGGVASFFLVSIGTFAGKSFEGLANGIGSIADGLATGFATLVNGIEKAEKKWHETRNKR